LALISADVAFFKSGEELGSRSQIWKMLRMKKLRRWGAEEAGDEDIEEAVGSGDDSAGAAHCGGSRKIGSTGLLARHVTAGIRRHPNAVYSHIYIHR
jgi:hypothetical protein